MRQDETVTEEGESRLSGIRDGLRNLLAIGPRAAGRAPDRVAEAPAGSAFPDDRLAPSAGEAGDRSVRGPEEARKRRISGLHRWYGGSMVGLIYLMIAMVQAATSGGSIGTIVGFELLAVCFAAIYIFAPVRVAGGGAFTGATGGAAAKAGVLLAMMTVSVPMIVLGGVGVTGLWIYIGVVSAVLFRLPAALAVAVVLSVAMLAVSGIAGEGLPWELAVTLVALTLWMSGFAGNIRLTVELRATREELADAAVAAERERIGRDLHDILGHSLTAVAVKAGLARTLVERGAPGAAGEIADIERLAREALADVRATAAGYRDVSVAAELAVAREVLRAAGIRPEIPTAVDDLGSAARAVFGYVIREAVTNVVRHSGARKCRIELGPCRVTITDDGSLVPGVEPAALRAVPGTGLRSLAERVSAVGGAFHAEALRGGGFRVVATVPSEDSHAVEPAAVLAPGHEAAARTAGRTA